MSSRKILFTGQTTDGSSTAINWRGGKGLFDAWGTFGNGTVKLQYSPDEGTTYFDDPNASFTSNGNVIFELPKDALIRANLSGSSGANIKAQVTQIRQGVE